jgi:hypothetical protein|tara:strand:- start:410 stop:772 length:363 start_codon:yes stop_codon:yes gene_type:complete
MQRRVIAKWRPALVLVLGGTLAAVFFLPLLAVEFFQFAGSGLGWMALFATAVLGVLLWRLVLRPVRRLTDYARSVARGADNAAPPDHFGTPEFPNWVAPCFKWQKRCKAAPMFCDLMRTT